jgi:uncharacterized membrane protein YdjX (TVP38/TMEM64 family)
MSGPQAYRKFFCATDGWRHATGPRLQAIVSSRFEQVASLISLAFPSVRQKIRQRRYPIFTAPNSMLDAILSWIEHHAILEPQVCAILALLFVGAAFLPFPRTLLLLAVGGIFGLPVLAIVIPSTTLGSILAFLLARWLLQNHIQDLLDQRPLWKALAQAVDKDGWTIVALMRFAGPLPNAVQNYLFGLTRIGVLPFSLITFIFTLPQIVFYVALGTAGRATWFDDQSSLSSKLSLLLAVAVVAAVMFLLTRRVRKILRYEAEYPL